MVAEAGGRAARQGGQGADEAVEGAEPGEVALQTVVEDADHARIGIAHDGELEAALPGLLAGQIAQDCKRCVLKEDAEAWIEAKGA